MRRSFRPGGPYAVTTVAADPRGERLLVGHHRSAHEPGFGFVSSASLEWTEDLSDFVQGTPSLARFTAKPGQILTIDGADQAVTIEPDSPLIRPLSPANGGVRYISAAMTSPRAAISGFATELWDVDRYSLIWPISEQEGQPAVAGLDAAGNRLAVSLPSEQRVTLYDVATQSAAGELAGVSGAARRLDFHPGGGYIAMIGWQLGIGVWNAGTLEPVAIGLCNLADQSRWCQAFHPALDVLAFGTLTGHVALVDLKADQFIYLEKLHNGRVWDMAFFPDGSRLATAGDDGALWLLDWEEMVSLGTSRA